MKTKIIKKSHHLKALVAAIAIASSTAYANSTDEVEQVDQLSYAEIAEEHSRLSSQNELLKLQLANKGMLQEIKNLKNSDIIADNEALKAEIVERDARIETLTTDLQAALETIEKLKETSPKAKPVKPIDRITLVKINAIGMEPKATIVIDGQTNKVAMIGDSIVPGVELVDITKQSVNIIYENEVYEVLLRSYPKKVNQTRRYRISPDADKAPRSSTKEIFNVNKPMTSDSPEGYSFYKKY